MPKCCTFIKLRTTRIVQRRVKLEWFFFLARDKKINKKEREKTQVRKNHVKRKMYTIIDTFMYAELNGSDDPDKCLRSKAPNSTNEMR